MQKEKEIWKDIPGYEGLYQVSNYGLVKSLRNNIILKDAKNRDGYPKVCLNKNGEMKNFYIHRLVASMFVPNPYLYLEINHIDGNKENNYFENLEWCTRSQNVKHSFAAGLKTNKKGSANPLAKHFYQFDEKGNRIGEWFALIECAQYLHDLDPKNGPVDDIRKRLTRTLTNHHKSCCGYLFSFEPVINYKDKMKSLGQKPIIGISVKDENDVLHFDYIQEVQGFVTKEGKKLDASLVCKCCLGKRPTHAGYKWRYEE